MGTPLPSHNLVVYVEPRDSFLPIDKLLDIPQEKALAENAVWYFIGHPSLTDLDKARLEREYKRRGMSMFIWKYYAAARSYLGGYKALSATLMLRRAL